jgi:hypothetical protein
MGMFKDMKDMVGVVRSDELKELKKKADAQPKVSMLDGVKMANQAMDQAQEMQAAMASQGLSANPMANMAAMSQGIQGNATVKGTTDTGQKLGDASVYDVELEVQIPNEAPYAVVHRQAIALAAMGNWQAGKVWPVRVDPSDRSKVIIG